MKIPDFVIYNVPLSSQAVFDDIYKNTDYPTVDLDALMCSIVSTTKTINTSEFASFNNILLLKYNALETIDGIVPKELENQIEIIAKDFLKFLYENGVFINDTQPYEFEFFHNEESVLLRKTKVFNY